MIAVGNPFGLGGTVTAGIVSARGRDIGSGPYDDFLQIDAPVNRGNSGGPTFNTRGEVIGVNTAIFSPSGGNVGIGFAIPAETVDSASSPTSRTTARSPAAGSACRSSRSPRTSPTAIGLKEAEGRPRRRRHRGLPGRQGRPQVRRRHHRRRRRSRDGAARTREDDRRRSSRARRKLTVWRDGEERTVDVELGKLPADKSAAKADDHRGDEKPGRPRSSARHRLAPAAA